MSYWYADVKSDGTLPSETAVFPGIPFDQECLVMRYREIWEECQDCPSPHWDRPFEEVLGDSIKKRPFLQYIRDNGPKRFFSDPQRETTFHSGSVFYMPGLPWHASERAFLIDTPGRVASYAEHLYDCRHSVSPNARETLDRAIDWLDFWGGHGHPVICTY